MHEFDFYLLPECYEQQDLLKLLVSNFPLTRILSACKKSVYILYLELAVEKVALSTQLCKLGAVHLTVLSSVVVEYPHHFFRCCCILHLWGLVDELNELLEIDCPVMVLITRL